MNRNINEDVAGYKNEFWKGLTFRECFFGAVAIVVGCGIILVLTLKFKKPQKITSGAKCDTI